MSPSGHVNWFLVCIGSFEVLAWAWMHGQMGMDWESLLNMSRAAFAWSLEFLGTMLRSIALHEAMNCILIIALQPTVPNPTCTVKLHIRYFFIHIVSDRFGRSTSFPCS
jgi:hypothetical protein